MGMIGGGGQIESMPLTQPARKHPLTCHWNGAVTPVRDRLRGCTANGAQPTLIDCQDLVDNLRFRLQWERGQLITATSYSAYRHAEEAHRLAFLHAKKFVLDAPFFLTFVVFPWFNNTIVKFRNSNKVFYRAFARRVFCQYRGETTLFSSWGASYKGTETVYDVSRELGGILFVEDDSIEGRDCSNTTLGYYFDNPNAHRAPGRGLIEQYLADVAAERDDFRYDNY